MRGGRGEGKIYPIRASVAFLHFYERRRFERYKKERAVLHPARPAAEYIAGMWSCLKSALYSREKAALQKIASFDAPQEGGLAAQTCTSPGLVSPSIQSLQDAPPLATKVPLRSQVRRLFSPGVRQNINLPLPSRQAKPPILVPPL